MRVIRVVVTMVTLAALTVVSSPGVASAFNPFWEGPRRQATAANEDLVESINRLRTETYGLPALESVGFGSYSGYADCIANENADNKRLAHFPASCNQTPVEAEILAIAWSTIGGQTNINAKLWNESDSHRRITARRC